MIPQSPSSILSPASPQIRNPIPDSCCLFPVTCQTRLAVSTRTPAPIVLETLTFFR